MINQDDEETVIRLKDKGPVLGRLLASEEAASPPKYPDGTPKASPWTEGTFAGPFRESSASEWELAHWAHPGIIDIWNPRAKVVGERKLWIAVMESQRRLGVDIPQEAIDAYREVQWKVDFQSIAEREQITRHDVKARLEEFNALASVKAEFAVEHAHKGMTGRDLDDNLEQAMVHESVRVLSQWVPQEVKAALTSWWTRYPLRGIKGPVGTAADMLYLFDGDHKKLLELEQDVARHLGFTRLMDSVGQVYPRSMDYEAASMVSLACDAVISERLRSGINPTFDLHLRGLVRGYTAMLAELAGSQWSEGDVSCSVVRRVALPGLFLAASAIVRPHSLEGRGVE